MADDVSLSEITSVKGDPELAYGEAGIGGSNTVLPANKGIELLTRAAELKSANDRWKFEQFQKNLQDNLKSFNELDVNGVMEKDYPDIMKDYASLAKDVADNVGVIRNPGSNPDLYAMLKEKEALLRGKIAQSKQDVSYRTQYKSMLDRNPDWATGDNVTKFKSFNDGKLGERNYDLPTPPEVYDISKHAALANEFARKQSESMTRRKDGAYIDDQGKEWTDESLFDRAFMQLGANTDGSGRTWKDLAVTSMKKAKMIPDGMPDEEALQAAGRNLIKGDKAYSKIGFDQPEMQTQELGFKDKWNKMDDKYKYAALNQQAKQHRDGILKASGYNYNKDKDEWYLPRNGVERNLLDGIDIRATDNGIPKVKDANGKETDVPQDGEYDVDMKFVNDGTQSLGGGFKTTWDGKLTLEPLKPNGQNKVRVKIVGGKVDKVAAIDDAGKVTNAGVTREDMFDTQRAANDILTGGKSERTLFERGTGDFSDLFKIGSSSSSGGSSSSTKTTQ